MNKLLMAVCVIMSINGYGGSNDRRFAEIESRVDAHIELIRSLECRHQYSFCTQSRPAVIVFCDKEVITCLKNIEHDNNLESLYKTWEGYKQTKYNRMVFLKDFLTFIFLIYKDYFAGKLHISSDVVDLSLHILQQSDDYVASLDALIQALDQTYQEIHSLTVTLEDSSTEKFIGQLVKFWPIWLALSVVILIKLNTYMQEKIVQ